MLSLRQFAAMNLLYDRYSLEYFLDSMKEIGFESIEFWGGAPHYRFMAPQKEQQEFIKGLFRSRGLKMICFTPEQCIYPFNIAAKDKLLREASVDYFLRCIEDAAGFGCERIMVTPGWGNFDEAVEDAWERSVSSLGALLAKAELEGIRIVYEILQPSESNLVTDLPSLKRMMENFSSSYLGCCVDTVPMCCAGETLEDYFRELGEKIQHIHLNDGTPAGHMAWGDGTQDMEEHLGALTKYDYQGYITFETCDDKFKLCPNEAFRQNYRAAERALQAERK